MGKGGYAGGSTIIHLGSNWFGRGEEKPAKATQQQRLGKRERAKARAATRSTTDVRAAEEAVVQAESILVAVREEFETVSAALRKAKADLDEKTERLAALRHRLLPSAPKAIRHRSKSAKRAKPAKSEAELAAEERENAQRREYKRGEAEMRKTVEVVVKRAGKIVTKRVGVNAATAAKE